MSLGIFDSKPQVTWLRGQDADAIIKLPGDRYVKIVFEASNEAYLTATSYSLPNPHTAREVSFKSESGSYTRTYTGHPLLTIVSVADAIVTYLRKEEPTLLTFSTWGVRARIYEALMRRMEVPAGYRLYIEATDSGRAYNLIRLPFRRSRKFQPYLKVFK